MNKYPKMGLFGFLTWLIPHISVLIFPLCESQHPLFESIMPVVVTICAVFFSILYLGSFKTGFLKAGMIRKTHPQ